MNRRTESNDQVTVMLFKDNLAARTFEVPLRWISWVGILLGLLVVMAISSSFVAGKYYWLSLKTSSGRVEDLEQEINQLKTSLSELEKKPTPSVMTSPPVANQTGSSDDFTFLTFPTTAKLTPPDPSTLSFAIRNPKAYWSGAKLKVRLSLQYTKGDEGNQQGQIVILSRGPDSVLAYPSGVLNTSQNKKMMIDLDKGESFSVSRFREVKADFAAYHSNGPQGAQSNEVVRSVEVYLFDKNQQLLAYLSLTPEPRKSGSVREAPSAESEIAPQATPSTETENVTH